MSYPSHLSRVHFSGSRGWTLRCPARAAAAIDSSSARISSRRASISMELSLSTFTKPGKEGQQENDYNILNDENAHCYPSVEKFGFAFFSE